MTYISIAAGAALSLACALLAHSFLQACKKEEHKRAFWLKGAAGLCFVALGLLTARGCANSGFAWRVALGLALGLLGDELLALRFVYPDKHDLFFSAGAGAFAIGHVLYILALLQLHNRVLPLALPIWLVILAASGVYAWIRKTNAGKFQAAAIGYIALVAFMCAVAWATAAETISLGALMFAVGGVCFVVSDDILCAYCYGNRRKFFMNVALHVCYYAAQLLIAWSMALI